jgi:PAT family beta-lactamase induction signal transducer AmpG
MVASAGALWIAADFGWTTAYTAMAVMVGVGIVTTLSISEPQPRVAQQSLAQEQRVIDWLERKAHWPDALQQLGSWFVGAVVCPFVDFFTRYGKKLAILILAFIASYRLTDFTMGVMANPFYLDVGFTLKEIAAVAKGFGVVMSILGTILGGVAVARLGTNRSLVLGSVLVIGSNLLFMTLAFQETPSLAGLAMVVSADNLAMGVAGTALIAYLSSLTSATYTATQYALFSSVYALPGKLLMGTSGFVVDAVGYPWFFVYTSSLGLPALVMLYFLGTKARQDRAAAGADLR